MMRTGSMAMNAIAILTETVGTLIAAPDEEVKECVDRNSASDIILFKKF